MTDRPEDTYDTIAAQLTAAMLRFDIGRLPRNPTAVPHDDPGRLGEVAFMFLPRQELVADKDLARHLEGLPKPVILAALAQKGMIATWWPAGLDERALAVWEHSLTDQQRWVTKFTADLSLADDELVLLETEREVLLFPAGAMRRWGDTYGVLIGWTLTDTRGDPRARIRLNLIRGDGESTQGKHCHRPS